MTTRPDPRPPTGLAGLFLYESGSVYVDAPHDLVERQRRASGRASVDTSWWDLLPVLTYWHEVDHFSNYLTSPYFAAANWVIDRYVSTYTHLWICLRAEGVSAIQRPLAIDFVRRALPAEAQRLVAELTVLRFFLNRILFAHPIDTPTGDSAPPGYGSFASWYSGLIDRIARGKGLAVRGDALLEPSIPLDPTRLDLRLSAVAVLEASAMFHESGYLAMRGIRDRRYEEWAADRLNGIYGLLFPTLAEQIDLDIVGVLLRYCMRGIWFPFLDERARARAGAPAAAPLDAVHPVLVLERGTGTLLRYRLLRAPDRARRSDDALYDFYRQVAEVLREELGIVTSAAPFAESDLVMIEGLKRAAPELAEADHYRTVTRERAALNDRRRRIFQAEADDPDTVFQAPLGEPLRVVFQDGYYLGRALDGNQVAHELQAVGAGVGEALVFGDWSLLRLMDSTVLRSIPGRPDPPGVAAELLSVHDLAVEGEALAVHQNPVVAAAALR